MKKIKNKIALILNEDTPDTPLKRKVGLFILFLILVSSVEVILESVVSLNLRYNQFFLGIDLVVSVIFSIEYILRLWTYRINRKKPTIKQLLSYVFSFYMIIDLVSILPFFISISASKGYGFLRIVRILRLFRLMKFARYMKSQNLVVNAIRNKSKELILSIQAVFFLTIILSAILYHIENTAQPENFGDIVDAFIWSLSKFIGGVGGYGDFEPITLWGQVMATVVGLLGIALFAVPAGIIGAGFVEEIESIKADEQIEESNQKLLNLFEFDHLGSWNREKSKIGLDNIRRKILKFSDAKLRLLMTEEELIDIGRKGKGIRLKNYNTEGVEQMVIESFIENTIYGTHKNIDSNINVVSTFSADQPFLGHFSYAISEYLNANYLSVEKCSRSNFNPEYKIDLHKQYSYTDSKEPINVFVRDFKNDLLNTVKSDSLVIYFACGARGKGDFHLLNGGAKGLTKFVSEGSLFENVDKLMMFKKALENNHRIINEQSVVNTHEVYGNDDKEEFQWMLKRERNANIICIYITAKLLTSKADVYYPTIKCIGDSIRNTLIYVENK